MKREEVRSVSLISSATNGQLNAAMYKTYRMPHQIGHPDFL